MILSTPLILSIVAGVLGELLLARLGDIAQSMLLSLITAYNGNLAWASEWAFNPAVADDLFPFNNAYWVGNALLQGVRNAYEISIPFTGVSFNLLDLLLLGLTADDLPDFSANYESSAIEGSSLASARKPTIMRVGRWKVVKMSQSIKRTVRGVTHRITGYYHPVRNFKVVVFSRKSVIKDVQIQVKRQSGKRDVADAWKKLKLKHPRLYKKYFQKQVRNGRGELVFAKNGDRVFYTMHHSVKSGQMQLMAGDIHSSVGHWGGNRMWNR